MKYKQEIYKQIEKVDWSEIDDKYKHLVFYSELRNIENNIYYANLYLNGAKEYCTEEYFETHYQNPRQFTIAVHRP
jgi:CRISPR/Cas system-associated protein Cas5 (RAMP superfamily)